jgi:putative membrane protein
VNRQAQAVVLFLVGGAMLHAGFTDLYLRYVKAGLRPLLLAAGFVLIAAAVATVWYERRGGEPHEEHGHGHVHREPRVSCVLVAPPALGSYSAMRTGMALQKPFGFPALPAGNPLPLSVVDYAGRAVYDHGHSLGGRRFELTGFVALDGNGEPYLTRMVLNCCAADAQPVKVGLTGRIPPILEPDTWLDVVGTYTGKRVKDPVNGSVIPFVVVSRARVVKAPADPYESPE